MAEPAWLKQLEGWQRDGTLGRLGALAELAKGYRSGDPVPDGVRTVRVPRSSGDPAAAVLCGLGHGGRSCYVKLAEERGGKTVGTAELLQLNPWLEHPAATEAREEAVSNG